ncbi:MAG: hypothetical protein LKK08_06135 [Bacteroidales bacterium]|jgi:hypothetical protein|nr:hypothetical protein [Bacteroidales bacterium]
MRPFNLEQAKAGAKICTREGGKARILAFDIDAYISPIAAAYCRTDYPKRGEIVATYQNDGHYLSNGKEDEIDLMMADD